MSISQVGYFALFHHLLTLTEGIGHKNPLKSFDRKCFCLFAVSYIIIELCQKIRNDVKTNRKYHPGGLLRSRSHRSEALSNLPGHICVWWSHNWHTALYSVSMSALV